MWGSILDKESLGGALPADGRHRMAGGFASLNGFHDVSNSVATAGAAPAP
jgi:hypothetical protein